MRLRRIKLSAVRKLDPGCLIDDLAPGLNIIGGDNEEGKSSLLLALRCALFLSHATTGQLRDRLVPYGSQATPTIELDFEIGGEQLALVKPFKRDGMSLKAAGRSWSNAEAESELEHRLRFNRPGRAPRQLVDEHLGMTGLFWVDQGTSFAGVRPIDENQKRLSELLAGEIGSVVAGDAADQVLDRARAQSSLFWTDTGRSKKSGPLADAETLQESLSVELTELEARVAELEGAFEKLARLQDERQRTIAEDVAGREQAKLKAAREKLSGLEALSQERRVKEQALTAAVTVRKGHAANRLARHELTLEIKRLGDEAAAANKVLVSAVDGVTVADADRVRIARIEEDCVLKARSAALALERMEKQIEWQTANAELTRQRGRIKTLAELDASRAEFVRRLAANPLTAANLDALRLADRNRRDAQAALAAVATRIEFHPDPNRTVTIEDVAIDSARPLDLSEPATLELEGYGRIRVVPGGEEVRAGRKQLDASEIAFNELAAKLGVDGLSSAEARALERQAIAIEDKALIAERERLLEGESPAAIAELVADLSARLARLGDVGSIDDTTTIVEVQNAAREAAASLEDARLASQMAARTYDDQRREEAVARSRLEDRQARLNETEALLARARDEALDEELAQAEQAARQVEHRLENEFAVLTAALGDADPAIVSDEIRLHEKALADLVREDELRRDRMRELEILIKQAGGSGLGEKRDAARERLLAAEHDVARLTGEAAAWKLLVTTLEAENRRARDRFTGPIRDRLIPLIRQILPNVMPVIDPQAVALTQIERNGFVESLDELSLGTREQLAVLVRLAFAELLLEREGEAPPIILDDALVYADEGRFDRMKLLLQKMADRHQIIILTCRPGDYRGLEAKRYDLSDCRFS